MTPEREKEIRDWVLNDPPNYLIGSKAAKELLGEIDRLRIALVQRAERSEEEVRKLTSELAEADLDFGGWRSTKARLERERDAAIQRAERAEQALRNVTES